MARGIARLDLDGNMNRIQIGRAAKRRSNKDSFFQIHDGAARNKFQRWFTAMGSLASGGQLDMDLSESARAVRARLRGRLERQIQSHRKTSHQS